MPKKSMNSVNITGHLGGDPSTYQAGETNICKFSVAVNDVRSGQEHTSWIDVTTFGKLADIASQYLSKGSEVGVSGKLSRHSFERQDGTKGSKIEVVAQEIHFIGKRASQSTESSTPPSDEDEQWAPF